MQSETSANGTYQLIMQGDGNLVIYNPGAIWSTKTNGHAGAYLVPQTDGNLVIYDSSGAIWASGTNGNPGDFVVMQSDGNFVIYSSSGKALWASGTAVPAAAVTSSGGGTVSGQAILNAASQWIGRTAYCWLGGTTSGPSHGTGDPGGSAPNCTNQSTTGFDCSGLALYAIYQAGGPNLFAAAHGPNLIDYGTPNSTFRERLAGRGHNCV